MIVTASAFASAPIFQASVALGCWALTASKAACMAGSGWAAGPAVTVSETSPVARMQFSSVHSNHVALPPRVAVVPAVKLAGGVISASRKVSP